MGDGRKHSARLFSIYCLRKIFYNFNICVAMPTKVCKILYIVVSPKEVNMDTMEKPTSVKECSRMTGIPYQWLVNEVKRGLNPPPRYQRPGRKGYQVIPKEVMKWYREVSEVK